MLRTLSNDLIFKRERNGTIVDHTEGNFDAFQHALSIDRNGFLLSVPYRNAVVENDPDHLVDCDLRFREENGFGCLGARIGDFCRKAYHAGISATDETSCINNVRMTRDH
jgi:hypothetical protein